ncbi:Pentatricopeptide repeat-containing protein [Camellia lanceoleosa]|uniref:Pentatricopeptide repeat-containing protein n=1 Tax=Camellia lanceoleosa TaxID=1840588 RepID=A0ACC0FNP9_9ERIC|nr:Pentatricopeptide repeat-containing protein [Camellia lanceoleosa]
MNAESSDSHECVLRDEPTISLDWVTYDLPIILHTGSGDKQKVDKIWNLSMSAQKITNRNYGCTLSSYLMLGYLREAGEVIDQWKQASATELVISNCNRLLKAFSDVGLMETAETFHTLLTEKGCDVIQMSQSKGRPVFQVIRER